MSDFKYIADISEQYLDEAVVVPCRNEQGFQTILIKNASQKRISSFFATDNLSIKLDKVLLKGEKEYFVHIIESKKTDGFAAQQFQVIYDYIFGKITDPISSVDLFNLISSLEEYFRLTPDPNRKKIQIGVFGELLSLCYLYESGFPEILNKYHNDFFSKHDIEISSSVRLEVKTTTGDKRIHHFRHDQICRKDIDVYVLSVLLEASQEGLTLYDLFMRVIGMVMDPDKKFALKKLMVRCAVSEEDKGLSFSESLAYSKIRIFDGKVLPKIKDEIPNGVSAIEYDVDCSLAKEMNVQDAIGIMVLNNVTTNQD